MQELLKQKKIRLLIMIVLIFSFISSGVIAYINNQGQEQVIDDTKSEEVDETQKEETEEKVEGRTGETEEESDEEIEDDSQLQPLLEEAKNLYYQGDYQASIEQYQEILTNQENKEARLNLAAISEELGNYQLAVEQYQQLLEQDEVAQWRLDLGVAYYQLGEYQQAKEELSLVLTSDIGANYLRRDANYYLALLATSQKQYEKAEQHLLEAIKVDDTFAQASFQLGEVKSAQGDYQAAIERYNQALRIDGSLKGVKRQIGLAHLELGQIEQAVDYLQQAESEDRADKLVKAKLTDLEVDYPDYFEEEERLLPEEQDREIPEEVEFKEIEPLEDPGEEIRVGIMDDQEEIYFRAGSDFVVEEAGTQIAAGEKGELYKVSFVDGNYYLELPEEEIQFSEAIELKLTEEKPVLLHNVIYGEGYYWGGIEDRQYRGTMEFLPREDGITAVNLVGLEEYLLAVVPSEMSASWELEALKVQAVAARSYTLFNLGRFADKGYDLCDTVQCAAYNGIGREHPRSNQAVIETSGEVATYDDQPINAVYSSNSGGHTENSEDVWGGVIPYLRGVSTEIGTEINEQEFSKSPLELREWLRERPDSYSDLLTESWTMSNYRWQRKLSLDYLEARLGIEDIQEIRPTKRGQAGSVEAMLVIGAEEEREFKNDLRSRFGELRSNRFWIQPQYENGELVGYKFQGSGWGHSVGMDQTATGGMVSQGYSYQEILKHFYTGIEIEDWN
ncbi:SpoIID/LytB domain-containing protein [Natroniella sulfidigena]|uniref:SpoIID/LytB domain-containing protein n=1 Tax=Natroniella sulfidigena TaxID=723921 RepID=UPI00200B6AA2|nr:SpoIID/LytB domain-containing protein [Natroniella sulfidigena]MCK8816270.1 SpoIID/LytB domain-containing protein [Natroniella sulfidigena]